MGAGIGNCKIPLQAQAFERSGICCEECGSHFAGGLVELPGPTRIAQQPGNCGASESNSGFLQCCRPRSGDQIDGTGKRDERVHCVALPDEQLAVGKIRFAVVGILLEGLAVLQDGVVVLALNGEIAATTHVLLFRAERAPAAAREADQCQEDDENPEHIYNFTLLR